MHMLGKLGFYTSAARTSFTAALLGIAVGCFSTSAVAQTATVKTEHVTASLVAHAPEGVGAEKPVWLGLLIRHIPHWHTYWKNPGDSGLATTMSWTLPKDSSVGPVLWPTPKKLPVGPLMNYGYE